VASIPEALAVAVEHHQAGRLQDAEHIYRQILQADPNHVDALQLLGAIATQVGNHEVAVDFITRAIEVNPDVPSFHSNLAVAYRALEKLDEAEAAIRQALQLEPDYAEAHFNLANTLQAKGKLDEAAASYRQALRVKPDYAHAQNNLGNLLTQQERHEEAEAAYRQALRLNPDYAHAHNNLGNSLAKQARHEEAEDAYRRALQIDPQYADASHNLGNSLVAEGKLDEAADSFRRTVRVNPDHAHAHFNLADTLRTLGRFDEATACYREAIRVRPDFIEAYNNLGIALRNNDKLDESVACYRQVLKIDPCYAKAHNNLGNTFHEKDQLDEAVACYRRALELKPDFAEAHTGLGYAMCQQGRAVESLSEYDKALKIDPDYAEARFNRAVTLLLVGDYEQGWPEYEWRWKTDKVASRSFSQPRWDGRPAAGMTILIHAEQGLGDTLQFIRYARLVKQQGATVIVQCQRALLPLLASCPGIDRLVGNDEQLPEFDAHAPLLSLPAIFKTTVDSVPCDVPYIQADAALIERWRAVLAGLDGMKIGISWQGDRGYREDRRRSIRLHEFVRLAEVPGVRLVSLQKGLGTEQLAENSERFAVMELGPDFDETSGPFMDTAAVMMNLDLVIACDTAIGHLAGALGVDFWEPQAFAPDWRWMLDRDDSPWYPTVRLFRQTSPGDWGDVFARIAAALRAQSSR